MLFHLLPISLLLTPILAQAPPNNFACKSASHPNPIVMLHGLGANRNEDLNYLQSYLNTQNFCTFSLTYGEYPQFPYVGGLQHIDDSAQNITAFVHQVLSQTGASQVDLLGHSEGAFQVLYVSKFGAGLQGKIRKAFAIAPPSHGTDFLLESFALAYVGGNLTRDLVGDILDTVGCPACNDLGPGGPAVVKLDNGPIAQKGIEYTILASKYDELVTPTTTAFVHESGVRNLYVQDFCPNDPVGHIGLAYDMNVWALVLNTLEGSTAGPKTCSYGSPGK